MDLSEDVVKEEVDCCLDWWIRKVVVLEVDSLMTVKLVELVEVAMEVVR